MNKRRCILGWLCALAVPAWGQVADIRAETNSIRLEWTAIPGNPYRVYATPGLVEPAWANLTPAGTAFADAQGFHVAPMGDETHFYCVLASDYMVVDLSGGPSAPSYPVSYTNAPPDGGWTDEYKTTKLALRRIPGGAFAMGSPTNELGRWDEEVPHAVTLSKDCERLAAFFVRKCRYPLAIPSDDAGFRMLAAGAEPVLKFR